MDEPVPRENPETCISIAAAMIRHAWPVATGTIHDLNRRQYGYPLAGTRKFPAAIASTTVSPDSIFVSSQTTAFRTTVPAPSG